MKWIQPKQLQSSQVSFILYFWSSSIPELGAALSVTSWNEMDKELCNTYNNGAMPKCRNKGRKKKNETKPK